MSTRRIIVSEFVTVDGVMEDPGGAGEFDRGGWAFKYDRGPEGDKFKLDEVMQADVMLLGRKTYEGFARAWPDMTDDVGFADKMNSMPKYVISATLGQADWSNSTILTGDVVAAVTSLKEQGGGDILVAGSGQLVRTLHRHGLIDEYRLMVFPVILGAGERLFGDDAGVSSLRLVSASTVGDGVLILTYERAAVAG
jgi:dihydrofolate reductase